MTVIQQKNIIWQPHPLNKTGNLIGWKKRMRNLCPNPKVGQVVYLHSRVYNQSENELIENLIGYLCIDIRANGEGVWQRGKVIDLATLEA